MSLPDEREQIEREVALFLGLAGLALDPSEEERVAAVYAHYRKGIALLHATPMPPETVPYLVVDTRGWSASDAQGG